MATGVKQVGGGGAYGSSQTPQVQPPEPRLREGSPWVGLGAVIGKEMADHFSSARMIILELLGVLVAFVTVWSAMDSIKSSVSQDPFLYLRIFTTAKDPWPAFIGLLGILVPLIAMLLIFDSVNGEFNRRTMSRVLAQPIYRDALLLGKFLAGLFTLALMLTAIWLLIMGLGMFGLGVMPGGEEVARIFLLLVATIFYGGIWLALGLVFSVVFRQPATSALAGIAVWLFFLLFWDILATQLAAAVSPIQYNTATEVVAQYSLQQTFSRLSPNTLFSEVMVVLLNPEVRSLGLVFTSQMQGALMGAPLPLDQSLVLVWPQMTGLIAGTILLFALAYILFQRQEIRA